MNIRLKILVFAIAICIISIMELPCKIFASGIDEPYVVINNTEIVRVGENYYNEETGEYLIWGKERGLDKSFKFKIRYSITSDSFAVNGSSVTISTSAAVTYDNDDVSGYDGFKYYVYLDGIWSRKLSFAVGGTESGKISGLVKGGKYKVSITTGGELPDNYYLQGNGTVKS